MADLTHFDALSLMYDPQTKAVSGNASNNRALAAELEALNLLHRSLQQLDSPAGVPPPPLPVNPKRSAQVTKLKDAGSAEFRKGKFADADRMYTLALQMALVRPLWEPVALAREEAALLLANRAQARMAENRWAEGAVDAEASVEARRTGNAKAWWRRGRCLVEMGRFEEAREWISRALEVEGDELELVNLGKEVEGKLARRKK